MVKIGPPLFVFEMIVSIYTPIHKSPNIHIPYWENNLH